MLVDDSAVIRGLIARMIAPDPEIIVVASVPDGAQAVKRMERRDIDVIVLDIEMPVMDGLTALPKLIEIDPNVKIVMASTLTEQNADISLKALEAGAADYIPKPTSTSQIAGASNFRQELLEKIKILGATARQDSGRPLPKTTTRTSQAPVATPGAAPATSQPVPSAIYPGKITLRPATNVNPPKILAIGSSTGGPQALLALFKDLKPTIGVPVVITQHMPPTFTRILSEHITKATDWTCTEAVEGEVLKPNHAYIAPGDFHMEVVESAGGMCLKMNQNPPENFCRPSVDPMLRSVVKLYGARVLTTILTGMGSDGLKGGKEVIDAGGTVIAQDEASSVVWGMPGAVATAGVCSAVLPLAQLGGHIMKFIGRQG
ncbi:MAG: chemotaxis response regulator protein-glutamate methylesterase [Rhodospirillaceae bacterium]|nr:chemotaxis response regulator protein-glutamate methylesterase [Rhodospirillaceae bacterium]MBT7943086.1 chemotaxis response regulator protein-glutamate methylesterase [Alphaproteobacteria bacterium]